VWAADRYAPGWLAKTHHTESAHVSDPRPEFDTDSRPHEAVDRHGKLFGADEVMAMLAAAQPGVRSNGKATLDAVRAHTSIRTKSDDMALIRAGWG
jgi:hypothetical protein